MEDSKLTGELKDTSVPEALFHISTLNQAGILRFTKGNWQKELYFREGKVIFAASNDPDEHLGPHLIRQGKVAYKNILQCSSKVGVGKRLGTVLVLEGLLQPNDLYQCVVDQVKDIVLNLFEWTEGTYEFIPQETQTQEVITLPTSIYDLILTGVTKIWRWSMVRKGAIGMEAVFRKKEGWSSILKKVTLTREMEILVDLLDQPRTLEELLQLSPFTNFETCRLIWAYSVLGIVEEILVAPAWESSDSTAKQPVQVAAEQLPEAAIINRDSSAEMASPTIKIQVPLDLSGEEKEPSGTAPIPVAERLPEQDPYITNPGMELSFADLAETGDSEDSNASIPDAMMKSLEWEEQIQGRLKEFNEYHRYLYEMVRLELGTGATNFIQKVLRKICSKHPLVLDGVGMDEFGELEEEVLHSNIEANMVEDYLETLEELLDEERVAVRMFLDRKRVEVIESGLQRMIQQGNIWQS